VAPRFSIASLLSVAALALSASCTGPQNATPTPVEQLPNPEFSRKPQIHFIVDSTSRFWNPPIPAELELKQRVRFTFVQSSELADLEAALRDLNSREGDLLVFSGTRLLGSAKEMSIFSHPSGRKTLFLQDSISPSPSQSDILRVNLGEALELLGAVCPRWKKELAMSCAWDAKIPGAPTGSARERSAIPIGFETPSNAPLKLQLKIDWVQWLEQFLHDFASAQSAPASSETWKKISLDSGTLRLDLQGSDPRLVDLKRILQEERLKRL